MQIRFFVLFLRKNQTTCMKYRILTLVLAMAAVISVIARETYNFNSGWVIDNQKKAITLPQA